MSPKRITNLALAVAGLSLLAMMATLFLGTARGLLTWWPVAGLGLALLLIMIALFKGMSLAAQRQIDRVDMMNDCNAGVPSRDKA